MIETMQLRGVTRQLAANSLFLGCDNDVVSLQLDPSGQHMLTEQVRRNLQKELSGFYGREVTLRVVMERPAVETPARQLARQESERLQQARESLELDPNVQALKSTFGASIQEESIRPLDD